jgi:NADH dehydrogenase/NADH:ubiquinone oxidoreductase subunit G
LLNVDNLNFEWISDKTRFFYDGLNRQRLTKPYLSYKILENEILEKPSNILDEKKHLLVPVS